MHIYDYTSSLLRKFNVYPYVVIDTKLDISSLLHASLLYLLHACKYRKKKNNLGVICQYFFNSGEIKPLNIILTVCNDE